jgi:hypothetical protein
MVSEGAQSIKQRLSITDDNKKSYRNPTHYGTHSCSGRCGAATIVGCNNVLLVHNMLIQHHY